MTKLPKIFLVVSAITLGVAIVAYSSNSNVSPLWSFMMPLCAVSFGLFLITFMMQKEMAQFDEEEAARLQLAQKDATKPVLIRSVRKASVNPSTHGGAYENQTG
jgi:hypothetical protein